MPHDTAAHRLETAPASWEAVEELFGVKGEPSRCWCRWFALPGTEFRSAAPSELKELLRARFDEDPEPGVLAFRGGQPVGWCAVEPRANYPRIERSQLLRAADLPPVDVETLWSVSCFVVSRDHRRSGVAAMLLRAAVNHAFKNGATTLEAYPIDTSLRPKAGPSDLYHGTVSLFIEGGFSVVSTPIPGRAVVRLNRALVRLNGEPT
jgi:GNAT superfamily N-acetyltransferase